MVFIETERENISNVTASKTSTTCFFCRLASTNALTASWAEADSPAAYVVLISWARCRTLRRECIPTPARRSSADVIIQLIGNSIITIYFHSKV